jgi:general stress protein 26
LNSYEESLHELNQIFGRDIQYALSTIDLDKPRVRIVDGFFLDGNIYITSYALAKKVNQINLNHHVALCYRLNTFQGVCNNIGHPLKEENKVIREHLKNVFHLFYEKHVDENDVNTCILKVELSNAVMYANDKKITINFKSKSLSISDFVDEMIYLI